MHGRACRFFGNSTKSQVLFAQMECISDSIAICHVAESADADASSYDVDSPTSVKKIPSEYLSGGCDSLLDLRGMTGLVASGVDVGWSEAKPFGCVESVNSVQEVSVTRETNLVRLMWHWATDVRMDQIEWDQFSSC